MSIAEIAVKRPLLIIVIFLVLILFGMLSYSKLNYKLLPNIEVASVSVSTIYPGASASEVENSVTRKLEDVFASVEGLEKISSTSQEGVSQISVQLKSGTNIDKAERDIQRKADQAQNQLPEGIDRPVVSKINLEEAPVVRAGVTSSLAPRALFAVIYLADKLVRLQTMSGKSYLAGKSLDELEKMTGPDWFRVNRQCLIHRQAIEDVSYLLGRRLALNLTIPFETRITISREKASQFLQWLGEAS